MGIVLNRNEKVYISNRILEDLEKLCQHDISKSEALEKIMKTIETTLDKKNGR